MERREHLHGMEDLSVVNEFLEVRMCMILSADLISATLDFLLSDYIQFCAFIGLHPILLWWVLMDRKSVSYNWRFN